MHRLALFVGLMSTVCRTVLRWPWICSNQQQAASRLVPTVPRLAMPTPVQACASNAISLDTTLATAQGRPSPMVIQPATPTPDQTCASNVISLGTSLATAQGRQQSPTALQVATLMPDQTCATNAISLGTSPKTVWRRLLPPSARATEIVPRQEDTTGSPMLVVSEVF